MTFSHVFRILVNIDNEVLRHYASDSSYIVQFDHSLIPSISTNTYDVTLQEIWKNERINCFELSAIILNSLNCLEFITKSWTLFVKDKSATENVAKFKIFLYLRILGNKNANRVMCSWIIIRLVDFWIFSMAEFLNNFMNIYIIFRIQISNNLFSAVMADFNNNNNNNLLK